MPSTATSRRSAGLLLAIAIATAVATVGLPVFGRGVFHPGDVVRRVAPWQIDAQPNFRPENRLLTDVVDAATPNRTEIRRRVLDGSYPLWNPYAAGGTPLGTQPQNGMLSPLQLPYLILPPSYAPAVAKLLQLVVALGFMFLFLRRLGLGRSAAVLGGLLFMNSAFLVVWTGFPHSDVAALIPALFWAVERAIGLRRPVSAAPVAVVIALMLLEGFPAVAAYAGLSVAVYALIRLWSASWGPVRERGRTLVRLAAAVVLGAGLAAVQLLPFASSLNDFDRSYREFGQASVLPLRSLATTAIPNAFGSPADEVDYSPRNAAEIQSFAGASTLVLLFGALLRLPASIPRRVRTYFWAGLGLMVVLIYVGGPLLSIFQKALAPVFEDNAIGRMRSVFGFFIAVLAAIGFEAFVSAERPPMSRRRRFAWICCCVAGAVAALAVVGFVVQVARDEGHVGYLIAHLWIPAVAAAATAGALVIGSRWRPGGRHPALVVAPLAFVLESLVFAGGFLPKIDRNEFYPVTSTHRFLAAHLGHERMAAEGATMFPGTQTFYRIRTVSSHAFHPKPWKELLEALHVTGGETQPLLPATEATAKSPILDRMGAAFWVMPPNKVPYGERVTVSKGDDPLLLSPARSLDHPLTLEGVRVVIPRVLDRMPPGRTSLLQATLLATDGTVLARGARRLDPEQQAGPFPIPIAEFHAGPGGVRPASIRIAVRAGGSTVRIAGSGQRPALGVIVARDDGLRLEFTAGATVYRRLTALPRIRWAGRAIVVADPAKRVATLARDLDRSTVILNRPSAAGSGRPAVVAIEEDSGDAMRIRVRAEGEGFLVIADSIQDGWRAAVDGRHAKILAADHAVGAVRIPAGDHLVSLSYRPAAWRTGSIISGASALVLVGTVVFGGLRRRRTEPA